MILVVGGTGLLGGLAVAALRERDLPVRILTRDPHKARTIARDGVEGAVGDLTDAASLTHALQGVDAVVCTAHGSDSAGGSGPKAVEGAGIRNLAEAAGRAGIGSVVYVSTASAAPDSSADIFRYKAQAERILLDGEVPCTVVRPTHLMDTWGRLLGEELVVRKRRLVFGGGTNPVSFVAGSDVAQVLADAAVAEAARRTITLGGPEALSVTEVLDLLEREFTVRAARTTRVPVAVLRAMGSIVGPFDEVRGRQMRLGALLDSRPQAVDSTAAWARFGIRPLTFARWLALNHDLLARAWGLPVGDSRPAGAARGGEGA